ncbi:hypothetical protein [Streptomyces sp. B6B3]|uniref:hypothetical protein n=1 Tax=Streptomyces sp. B6B3 TaxID=3153570 RepID=UPI00325D502B
MARAEDLLNACVREYAAYLAALDKPQGPKRTKLVAAIGTLIVEHTAPEPEADRCFEALLKVGRAALDAEDPQLARRAGDAAVALRSRSKGAWRLRGEALDALGRDREAIDAFERYQALGGGSAGGAGRAGGKGGGKAGVGGGPAKGRQQAGQATQATANGHGGDPIAKRLVLLRDKWGAVATAGKIDPEARLTELPPEELQDALATTVERRLARHGAADPDSQRLAAAYGTYTRLAAAGAMDDPLLGGSEPLGVGPLRSQLKGRSVCVVANAEAVAESDLGEEIDAYDVVVRLDSFPTGHWRGTGKALHLHAVSHRSGGTGWRRKAEIRLVFGDKPVQWRDAVRHRLVPGAQTYVGDRSLSRPLRDPALIGEPRWAADASTGFTVARLLDFLDVSPRLDLIGFTLPDQLRAEERQWVLSHARTSNGLRVSLR